MGAARPHGCGRDEPCGGEARHWLSDAHADARWDLGRGALHGDWFSKGVLSALSRLCEIFSAMGAGALPQSQSGKPGPADPWHVRTASRLPDVIAVTGLAFEARIAAGAGVRVVCAGNGERLRRALRDALSARCSGIISFGLAGGLDRGLECGRWIVADAIIGEAGGFGNHP